uniref:Uncharacterized protein n=1 Tax=Picea sitchensis TaxID=3332 RepID=D5ACE5_PICSI|nr:unknown [Picea sitchensis]
MITDKHIWFCLVCSIFNIFKPLFVFNKKLPTIVDAFLLGFRV